MISPPRKNAAPAAAPNTVPPAADTSAAPAVPDPLAPLLARLDAMQARIDQRLDQMGLVIDDVRRLVGPFGVRLADDQLLVQTLYGNKYIVEPQDLIMTPQLVVYRQWEAELSRFFAARAHPDLCFVDIGANFGYFTCLVASRIGTSGRGQVVAIEPNPKLLRHLRANVVINWSLCPVTVHEVALGRHSGEVDLWIPSHRAANASLTPEPDGSGQRVRVPLRPLDELVPAGTRVDLIKLDVEGHEADVLRGASRVLAESPQVDIVIEWSARQMRAAGTEPAAMLALFDELGLAVHHVPDDAQAAQQRRYTPYARDTLLATDYDNLLLSRA